MNPVSVHRLEQDERVLDIEVWHVDHEEKVVRLAMLDFDADLVAQFVAETVPDDYVLFILMADRSFPATLLRLPEGRLTLRLSDPDADYLSRCRAAIDKLLPMLAGQDIEAVVVDIDRFGRPDPLQGALSLWSLEAEERVPQVTELVHEIEREFDVHFSRTGLGRPHQEYFARTVESQPHFAWNPVQQQVVRRNWPYTG
jgi:hypothetical protein